MEDQDIHQSDSVSSVEAESFRNMLHQLRPPLQAQTSLAPFRFRLRCGCRVAYALPCAVTSLQAWVGID